MDIEITNENYEQKIAEHKNLNILITQTRCAACPSVKAWWKYGPIINTDEVFEPEDIATISHTPSMLIYRDGKLVGGFPCESQKQTEHIIGCN